MFWPCETRTSTCRSFATISSGLYRFLAIAVLLDVKDIPQVGPLQWGWITRSFARALRGAFAARLAAALAFLSSRACHFAAAHSSSVRGRSGGSGGGFFLASTGS